MYKIERTTTKLELDLQTRGPKYRVALINMLAISLLMFGFSGRVLCFSEFHTAIEYGEEGPGECDSECGDCFDVSFPQDKILQRPDVSGKNLDGSFQNILSELILVKKIEFPKRVPRLAYVLPKDKQFESSAMLGLRTIVLLN